MGLLLLLSGLGLLALPAITWRPARQLAPDRFARLSAGALACGAAVVELATILHAGPTVLRAIGAPALASVCERMLGPLAPGGAWAGWMAAAAAVIMPVLAWVGTSRARAAARDIHLEPGIGQRAAFGDHELVVLPIDQPMAVSVAHRGSHQIIVSERLIRILSPLELDAVLRHEAAHLDHRHQRFLILAAALEHGLAFIPTVRPSTGALRVALERWADEEAAGETAPTRDAVRSALLGVTWALVNPELAAFSAADTVLERLRALESAPSTPSALRQALIYTPGAVLIFGVAAALGAWASNLRILLAMAGRCPA